MTIADHFIHNPIDLNTATYESIITEFYNVAHAFNILPVLKYVIENNAPKGIASGIELDVPYYHSTQHMIIVAYIAYCISHKSRKVQDLSSPRHTRNLLIAALFHDFNHSLGDTTDDLNITRATLACADYLSKAKEHVSVYPVVRNIIKCTVFPFTVEPTTFAQRVIRDADIIYGLVDTSSLLKLNSELGLPEGTGIDIHIAFHKGVRMYTPVGNMVHTYLLSDVIEKQKEPTTRVN